MSIRAAAIRFYLRHTFKRRHDPSATAAALRANVAALVRGMPKPPRGVRVTTTDAGGIPAEWVVAPEAVEGRIILYFHGGGYASGSPASARDLVWRLSAAARARALVLDYRLAPEHPFPAAIEDGTAAYRHLLSTGVAPASIAFAGDSAGGGLALGTLVKLRDEGAPLPAAVCAFSPWTDLAITGASAESNREADPMIRLEAIRATVPWYLGSTPATEPHASPLYADHHHLPPTLLHVGSTEVLLDDSVRLAERMKAANVDVTLKIWPDMPHVFQGFALFLPEARQAILEAGQFIEARVRPGA